MPCAIQPRLILLLVVVGLCVCSPGCQPSEYRKEADIVAADVIKEKQMEAFGRTEPFTIEQPSITLRRRLIMGQNLAYSRKESLGTDQLTEPAYWPEEGFPGPPGPPSPKDPPWDGKGPLHLGLEDALKVAARNSFNYQSQKEGVFRSALSLDLARQNFRNSFTGMIATALSTDLKGPTTTATGSGSTGWTRKLKNGLSLSSQIAFDVARLLSGDRDETLGAFADATISIPLLAGSGTHIVTEPLTQSERNMVYALYDFERFKRRFSVEIASAYLSVLRSLDSVKNVEGRYLRLVEATRRAREMFKRNRMSGNDVDQSKQDELSSRNSWITAKRNYEQSLDNFKITLGLPADADIELDVAELNRLAEAARKATEAVEDADVAEKPDETDDSMEVTLKPGPLEMEFAEALGLAFEHRLDLRTAHGRVEDAQRKVVVAGDALRSGLSLSVSGSTDDNLRAQDGNYRTSLSLSLPFERTSERNAYRNSLISLESSVRSVQSLEDAIKISMRRALRNLAQARESTRIQRMAVPLADRRVRRAKLMLERGTASMRDVLEAEEAFVNAQNELTSALVDYRISELQLQRDMGVLEVNEEGIWREYKREK